MRTMFSAVVLCIFASISRADEATELRAILDKALQAHGGAEKLAAITAETWKTKDVAHFKDQNFTSVTEWFVEGAARARKVTDTDVMGNSQRMVRALDGDKGLVATTIGAQSLGYRVDDVWIAEEKEQNYSRWIASLQPLARHDKSFNLAALGESKIDGRAAIGLRVSSQEHRDVELFFDKKDGTLVRAAYTVKHVGVQNDPNRPAPEVKEEVYYSHYKDFDGIKKATKVLIKFDGTLKTESELTEYKRLDKLEDNLLKP